MTTMREEQHEKVRAIAAAQERKTITSDDLIAGGVLNEVLHLDVPQKVIRAHDKAQCLACREMRSVDRVQFTLPIDEHCCTVVGYVRCRTCKTAIAAQILISHAGLDGGAPFAAPEEGCTLPQPPRRSAPTELPASSGVVALPGR
jgi:hypothetical protein